MISNLALIIDDDEQERFAHKRVISRSGKFKNILCFSSGLEGLEFLATDDRAHVDVIFLDIKMPRMNGIEFIETATERFGNSFATVIALLQTTPLPVSYLERIRPCDCNTAKLDKPISNTDLDNIEAQLFNCDQ
jgi:CheY-like chemotaxis protein